MKLNIKEPRTITTLGQVPISGIFEWQSGLYLRIANHIGGAEQDMIYVINLKSCNGCHSVSYFTKHNKSYPITYLGQLEVTE